ncbi:hypothetical protein [Mesorhizobium sp. BR-1-1-10]|uniref:hypothetical protein n=1 Tax=Mesorhizobium sp. BR-1-1-10 TaxID=2876660 RepID=UPI001CD09C51|nr:hypothetical protein [Mesorhizobium sp. BR-1-1-10]MBZ9975459.1 hypothetical protein [Mesorhizobium sp. BR-1-1-10]
MAKDSALTLKDFAIVAPLVLGGANFIAARYWGYPFLYCWAAPTARDLYLSWGQVAVYYVVGFILITLLRGNKAGVILGVMIFIGIFELPRIADTMFRLGGSCG